ncbi:type VI secretion system baseplate subunit TssK [Serratia sp. M24T3]|uniref:type VI secretion system baseplate subunit TssK n=1 Tax=Serratia sp. M24T3 TaxID=932213 RepID=UPI00025B9BED|nr:type VI secretion system baseplate subunit TssK [Serratia sp. M24T3]EIC84116.1 hypothetical protein SPM24T3_13361 [Serratia sp. M24T3]
MNTADKVIWTEGMFLRPHHFQQSERWLEAYSRSWGKIQTPYYWGFMSLELDASLLRQGKLAIASASGIMPDGTPFNITGADNAPAPLALPENQSDVKVVLALPECRSGRNEVIFSESSDSLARLVTFENEVDDLNASAVGTAAMQFGKLRFSLMLESSLNAEWTAISVARITGRSTDRSLKLDPQFIPPVLNAQNDAQITSFINDMHGVLNQRSEQMSQRLQQAGRGGNSEMIDFMLLALINRHIGQISHSRQLPQLHPERLFSEWLQFATELSTWSATRTPGATLPVYDHDNLAWTFGKLMLHLRQGLSLVMEENALQLTLTERSHGLFVATVSDVKMIRELGFVLAVKADVPSEMLMTHFAAQMKIAPVTRIRDLVQLQLPGIGLRAMPAAPRQIPWHAGYVYFELEKSGDLWRQMEKSEAFALHLAGEFPGLDMQLWALRNLRD